MKKAVTLWLVLSSLFFSESVAQISIDGVFNEPGYSLLASRLNSNSGFAPDCEFTTLYYSRDNENLYLGFECRVQNVPNQYNPKPDGLGIFLNFSSQQGMEAGQPLGIDSPEDLHFLNGSNEFANPVALEFKADFEVDYLLAVYSNSTPNQIIVDAVTHVPGYPLTIQNIGTTNQNGTSASGPIVNGVFTTGSIEFAFIPSTGEGSRMGFEIKIPFSEVNGSASTLFELFASIVASTAFFSDQTIPGNVITGNSGWAPDYLNNLTHPDCTCPNPNSLIGNGPYHTLLPIEIIRPNGGETFFIGYPDTIKWNATLNNIKLLYSTDSGSSWNIIENSLPASTGNYVWTVPNSPSISALVRISDALNDSIFDASDNVFTISEPPVITVLPDSLSFLLNEGDSAESVLQISNVGSGILNYEISIENVNGKSTESLNISFLNSLNKWEIDFNEVQEHKEKNFQRYSIGNNSTEGILPLIITDPIGDAQFVDVTQIRGRSTGENIELEFIFETDLNPFDFGGFLGLDIDQDWLTGVPLPNGLSSQEVGCEYIVYFFSLGSNLVDVVDQFGNYLGSFPADWDSRSFRFSVPLSILNNDDGIMNIAAIVGNNSGPTDWIPDEGYGILGGNLWLTLEPLSGIIIHGNSENITVRINTDRIDGGEYYANILISSNDPVNNLVTIPVHLTVVGQPNLVAADSVQFGQVYVGYPESEEIELKNNGSVTLEITDISSSNPLFNVSLTNFSILPNDTALLIVSFNPATTGPESGTLSIISNDPSSPAIINLFGEGVFPPVISVTPDSFFYDLNVGDSVVTQLTIENTGLGELVYQITDRQISGASAKIKNPYRLKAPVGKNEASLKRLLGKEGISFEKLITKINHKVNDRYNPDLPILVTDSIGDGGIVDIKEIRGRVSNSNLEIEYIFADGINISDSIIAELALDVDRNPMTGIIDPFHYHDLGVDYYIDYYPLFLGNQIEINEVSTGTQYFVPYNINGTTISYSVPLSFLGNDDGEMDLLALCAYNPFGVLDWAPNQEHATLFNVFWLNEDPTSGIIPPGGNISIEISANTSELIGGNYLASIDIQNNDPANPVVEIPFAMHLTGVPQITLSDDTLDFGETYIGYHNTLSLAISSSGTDSLIGNIVSSNPEFLLSDSSFTLPVGGVKNVEIQFHPADIGFSTAILTINSNAGVIPLTVYLTGQGVIPPNILVDTTAFIFSANTGDTLSANFMIYNTGGSDLIVELSDQVSGRSSSERLFAAGYNIINEINPDNGQTINSFPAPVPFNFATGLAFSGEYLFFTDGDYTTDIFVLNPQNGNIITTYPSQSSYCDGLAYIDPYLYVTQNYSNTIRVLNSLNGNLIRIINSQFPIWGGLDGGENRLFASDGFNLYELNLQDGSIINNFNTINSVYGIGFTGERLFTSNTWAGIDEYDPNSGQFIQTISTSGYAALAGGGNRDAEWLTVSPSNVTIPAGDSASINLIINTEQIPVGYYIANIVMESNDPVLSTLKTAVILDIITGIEGETELPKSFALYQNFPNPFNPSTTFSYDLPEQSRVVLKLYNIVGEEVAVLVNTEQSAGTYNISWNASGFATGVYLYRLQAEGFVVTKKLILMK